MIAATTPAANRKRIKQGYGLTFWQEQAELLRHWAWGYLPPKGLALGDLPQANIPRTASPSRLADGRRHPTFSHQRLPEEED